MTFEELLVWSPLHYLISIIVSLTIVFLIAKYASRLNQNALNIKYSIFVALGIYLVYLAIIGFIIRYSYYKDYVTPTLFVFIATILLIFAIRNGSRKIVLIGVVGFVTIFTVRAIFGIILTKADNKSPINRPMLLNTFSYKKNYIWKNETQKPLFQFKYSPVYYIQNNNYNGRNSIDIEVLKNPIDDALEEGFGGRADILTMTLIGRGEEGYIDNPETTIKETKIKSDGSPLYSGYRYSKLGKIRILFLTYLNGGSESSPIILGNGFNINIGVASDSNTTDNFTSEQIRKEAEKIISTIELFK